MISTSLSFYYEFQVNVITKLADEEGKNPKAFLRQQPFAKPGEFIFVKRAENAKC